VLSAKSANYVIFKKTDQEFFPAGIHGFAILFWKLVNYWGLESM
jgi:hypothetical protein